MRSTLALVLVSAAIGCSGNEAPATHDMAVNVDLFMAPADLAGAGPCNVGTQSGCGASMKCVPKFGTSSVSGTCVADGTVTEGQPCMPTTEQNLI